jgi:hypothetical protein
MDNPPNANIHTIVKAQIVFLLSTLTEDNFDRNQIEIRSVGTNWTLGYIEGEVTDMNVGSACASCLNNMAWTPTSTSSDDSSFTHKRGYRQQRLLLRLIRLHH